MGVMRTNYHRLRQQAASITRQAGYTLAEMAIVLAIMGTVAGGVLTIGHAKHEASKINITNERLDAIEDAIRRHSFALGYLPCPAESTPLPGEATYGVSANCTGIGAPPVGIASAGTVGASDEVWIGGIPTRTLNLANSIMYDGWQNRFSYAVVRQLAQDAASYEAYTAPNDSGIIQITDFEGDQVTDANADTVVSYAIVSHGKDGKGAISRAGTIPNGCTDGAATPTLDDENCDNDAIILDTRINDSNSITANYYDDIVRWRTKHFMLPAKGSALITPPCQYVYIPDANNQRVQKLDENGNFVLEFGVDGTNDGELKLPESVAIGSSGEILVMDNVRDDIQAFDSQGNFLWKFGSTGSADNQFQAPEGIAVDGNTGNIWVADKNNYYVKQFDSSGTFISKIGTGAAGSGAGEFDRPVSVTIDSASNVWVTENLNDRAQMFDSAGTHQLTFDANATGFTMDNPQVIFVDSEGNVWVGEQLRHVVRKYDNAGNYLGVTLGVMNTAGTNDGEFTFPHSIAEVNGELWVGEWAGNRIQVFDISGNHQRTFGTSGTGNVEFNNIGHMAVATETCAP